MPFIVIRHAADGHVPGDVLDAVDLAGRTVGVVQVVGHARSVADVREAAAPQSAGPR
jgi:hypothetical protein